jgi:hypothetical protein
MNSHEIPIQIDHPPGQGQVRDLGPDRGRPVAGKRGAGSCERWKDGREVFGGFRAGIWGSCS